MQGHVRVALVRGAAGHMLLTQGWHGLRQLCLSVPDDPSCRAGMILVLWLVQTQP